MEIASACIPAATGIPDYGYGQGIGHDQHQSRKLIQHKNNTERCGPFTYGINTDFPLTANDQIADRNPQAEQAGNMADAATPRLAPVGGQSASTGVAQKQQSKCRKCRQKDTENRGMLSPEIEEFSHYGSSRSEEHTSELQSRENLVCRLLLEKKK